MLNVCYLVIILIFFCGYLVVTARYLLVTGCYCSLRVGYCLLVVVTARYRSLLLVPTISMNELSKSADYLDVGYSRIFDKNIKGI